MTKETMTVHKALAELKTLEARICDSINSGIFVYTNKHSNNKVKGIPVTDFNNEIKAEYQKINDLIKRREALKRAVVLSNATTSVTINGKEMTVAEAIEMKNNGVPLYKSLITKLSRDNKTARASAELANGRDLENRADDYIRTSFGAVDKKNLPEDADEARRKFIENQTVDVIDPIKAIEKIEELNAMVQAFMVDVDAALSVSNALTTIEIEY